MIANGKYVITTPVQVDSIRLNVYTAAVDKKGNVKAFPCSHVPVRD